MFQQPTNMTKVQTLIKTNQPAYKIDKASLGLYRLARNKISILIDYTSLYSSQNTLQLHFTNKEIQKLDEAGNDNTNLASKGDNVKTGLVNTSALPLSIDINTKTSLTNTLAPPPINIAINTKAALEDNPVL